MTVGFVYMKVITDLNRNSLGQELKTVAWSGLRSELAGVDRDRNNKNTHLFQEVSL
jgi:hypothetical protein